MDALCPACPPGASRSTTTVCKPLARRRTPLRRGRRARRRRCRGRRGAARHACAARARRRARPSWGSAARHRRAGRRRGGRRRRAAPARAAGSPRRVRLDLEPAVGHVVVGEEGLHLHGPLGPPVPDDTHLGVAVGVVVGPVAEQLVEHGVEPVLGRVPRLHQVVVERDVVDRADRDVGVGVRRQEQQLGVGGLLPHLPQHLDARHPRHPLVGDDGGDRTVLQQLVGEDLERLLARRGPQDPIVLRRSAGGGRARRRRPRPRRRRPRGWRASPSAPPRSLPSPDATAVRAAYTGGQDQLTSSPSPIFGAGPVGWVVLKGRHHVAQAAHDARPVSRFPGFRFAGHQHGWMSSAARGRSSPTENKGTDHGSGHRQVVQR